MIEGAFSHTRDTRAVLFMPKTEHLHRRSLTCPTALLFKSHVQQTMNLQQKEHEQDDSTTVTKMPVSAK